MLRRVLRIAVVLTLFTVGSAIALAQDSPETPKKNEVVLKEIVKPQERLSKRIFLVIDVSGSMREDGKVGKALQALSTITGQPLDDFEIALIAFDASFSRWPGIADAEGSAHPVPKGWARLPSAQACEDAEKWIKDKFKGGGTEPQFALAEALREERDSLSIVLVTDGLYHNSPVETAVQKGQAAREKKGLGKAVVLCYGVGEFADRSKNLKWLGTEFKGGFFVDNAPVAPVTSREPD